MKIKIIIITIICFILTGCYDYNELNELAIANGISIDLKDDKYLVSILISNSHKNNSSNEENQATTSLFQGEGKTLDEAITNLELTLPKKLYLGHINIIIISEEYAKTGIYNLFDYFTRNPELLKKMYLAVSKDIEAYKTLATISPLEMFSSKNIISNIETNNTDVGNSYLVLYSEALFKYVEPGYEFVIPSISLTGDTEESTKEENIKNPISKSHLIILNLSVFKADKLLTHTTTEESKGINILTNNIKNLEIIENDFTASVNNIKCKIKFELNDNNPIFKIKTNFSYKIVSVDKNLEINKEEIQNEIHKIIDKHIKTYINKALYLSLDKKVDILGLGNLIYKEEPNYFNKNKKDYLEKLKFDIEINSKLESNGEITKIKEK